MSCTNVLVVPKSFKNKIIYEFLNLIVIKTQYKKSIITIIVGSMTLTLNIWVWYKCLTYNNKIESMYTLNISTDLKLYNVCTARKILEVH